MMQTTSANSVTPSISAAAMIIEVRMSPPADGWRAVPSMAAAASRPMPKPAPRTARPAPIPAAKYPSENWFMVQPPHCMNAKSPGGGEWLLSRGMDPRPPEAQPAKSGAVGSRLLVRVLRHADEQRGKHREHVGLHQRDEQLQHEDAEREGHAHRRDVHRDEQRQRDEEEDDDVPRHHVGEEADRQRERLGEQAEQLDHEH